MARRAWQDAIDVATVFESPWPQIYRQYVPASLELRAQAAAALGGLAEAAQYRARVAAIHSALKLHVSRGSTCPARNASREWRSAERVAL